MDFGLLNNLNSIQDAAPTTSSRPEATADRQPAAGPSFGAVLAARSKPSAPMSPASSSSSRADDETVESGGEYLGPESAPAPKTASAPALTPKTSSSVDASNDFSKVSVESNDRESAWSEFLGDMSEKLQVEPKDILKAFESLSDEDLAAKPEESVDKMIQAMGLTDQNAILARQILGKLIQKTEKPVEAPAPGAHPIETLRAMDKSLTAALESMDAHMLMNKPLARPVAVVTEPESTASSRDERSSDLADLTASTDERTLGREKNTNNNDDAPKFAAPPAPAPEAPAAVAAPAPAPAPAVARAVPAAAMNDLVAQMQPVDAATAPKLDAVIANTVGAPAQGAAIETEVAGEGFSNEVETPVAAPAPKSAQKALDALIAKATKFAEEREDARDEDEDSGDLDSNLVHPGDARLAQTQGKSDDFASRLAPEVQGTAPAGPTNGPELIDNARLMVRNGGGEMKVTVNSEVGEVAMNVSVKDGKVSVSMVAETDDAKKILEHQLNDLKSQLTAHNLQIDKLHVDTSSNLGQQSESNQNQNQGGQRHAQHSQGWEGTNSRNQGRGQQQNQARRQMAYDAPVNRAYGTRAAGVPAATPRPAARLENSGRLNLVA